MTVPLLVSIVLYYCFYYCYYCFTTAFTSRERETVLNDGAAPRVHRAIAAWYVYTYKPGICT
jgi:hypothetical protein